MRDVIFVLIPVAFFAIAAAYVRGCARIIGPEETAGGTLVEGGQREPDRIETGDDLVVPVR